MENFLLEFPGIFGGVGDILESSGIIGLFRDFAGDLQQPVELLVLDGLLSLIVDYQDTLLGGIDQGLQEGGFPAQLLERGLELNRALLQLQRLARHHLLEVGILSQQSQRGSFVRLPRLDALQQNPDGLVPGRQGLFRRGQPRDQVRRAFCLSMVSSPAHGDLPMAMPVNVWLTWIPLNCSP